MRNTIEQLGPQANRQWSRRLLRACSAVIGIAALLDFPLILTLNSNVSNYVFIGNSIIVLMCLVIFITSPRGSIAVSALLLGSGLMALTATMPSATDLLNSSTGAALVVPVLLVGVVTNFRLAMLFGLIAIGILIFSALVNDLAWTPYTYTSAFIIAITLGLLWLIHNLIATVQERNRQLAMYAAQVEELAVERERTRLAREVHDGVGHVLMTVNMQIEAARAHFDNDPASARESLSVAQRYIKEAAADVRRSIATLRTPALEVRPLPLPEMVAVLAETARSSTLDVHVQVKGAPRPLPPQASFALNRVVQEALTNVRKHARASKAVITLDYSDAHHVCVSVRDNGVGAAAPGSGYGLIGIHERMQALGGTAATGSDPGGGFSVTVEIPV